MPNPRVVIHGANQTPSPAMVYIFMSRAGIPFEEVRHEQLAMLPDSGARTNRTDPAYIRMNPTRCVPTLRIDGEPAVGECSAILRALSMRFFGLDSGYYPVSDQPACNAINYYLDWHITELRPAWMGYQAALMGGDAQGAAASFWGVDQGALHNRPNGLVAMVELFTRHFLGAGPFVCGRPTPSIADFAALAELALIELMGVPVGSRYTAWREAFVDYLGDDPAWTAYRDDAIDAVLSAFYPPPPENTTGYPFGWFEHLPE